MTNIKTEERGWAGHFVAAEHCMFRRNTLVTCGEKRIVVSTIGAMHSPKSWFNDPPYFNTVGCERYYETMCFWAKKVGVYWDADVELGISFNSPWRIDKLTRSTDLRANKMHEKVVKEIVSKIEIMEKQGKTT
jgi:hypothetical protein